MKTNPHANKSRRGLIYDDEDEDEAPRRKRRQMAEMEVDDQTEVTNPKNHEN